MSNNLKYLFSILLISMINNYLYEKETLIILIENLAYSTTGKKGTIVFYGNFLNDEEFPLKEDTSKNAYFTKQIEDIITGEIYDIDCGPWFYKNEGEDESLIFNIFCIFNETIPKGDYNITFSDTFNYSDFKFFIYSSNITFLITKKDYDIIDLYADMQIINMFDNKDIYDLKFKINIYNNEKIFFLISNLVPVDCKQSKNELICPIGKNLLEKNLGLYSIYLASYTKDNNLIYFDLFPEIKVQYDKNKKKDIYIGITNLLTKFIWAKRNYLVYETNVTDILNIFIEGIHLEFEGLIQPLTCLLIKGQKLPLLFVCFMNKLE